MYNKDWETNRRVSINLIIVSRETFRILKNKFGYSCIDTLY